MYSTDLTRISIDDFQEMLLRVHLLPSQRDILHNLPENVKSLKGKGYQSLQDLQILLKKKGNYGLIAEDTGVSTDYLIILNRMVNSFVVKAVPIEKLEIFSQEELVLLKEEGIKSTKEYYEAFLTLKQREAFSKSKNISLQKMEYAIHITDLLRINGVGVGYAKILYEMGIKKVEDYNKTPSEAILKTYKDMNFDKKTRATLGVSDIDYCRRFCEKLDCEI